MNGVYLPFSVKILNNNTFIENEIYSVIISDSFNSIGSNAFSGCYFLKNIFIPKSVTSIGESAFSDCHNLTNVIIQNSDILIGDYAFSFCFSLSCINIPGNARIGFNAFIGCLDSDR